MRLWPVLVGTRFGGLAQHLTLCKLRSDVGCGGGGAKGGGTVVATPGDGALAFRRTSCANVWMVATESLLPLGKR